MADRKQKLGLGLFLLVTLVMLGGLVILFGGTRQWFTQRNAYLINFDDAPGMEPGVPVRKSGVRVGQVRNLKLTDDGRVRVTVELNRDFAPRLSDEAVITRGLIATDTAIDFVPRKIKFDNRGIQIPISTDVIPVGSEIEGISPFNARQYIDEATNEAKPTIDQIRRSLKSIEELTPQVRETLREVAELARSARETVPEIRRTNDEVREAVASAKDQIKEFGPELKKTTEAVRTTLANGAKFFDDLNVIIRKYEPKIDQTIAGLNRTMDIAGRTLDNAGKLLSEENQKKIVATLDSIKAASGNLEGLTKEASETLKEGRAGVTQFTATMKRVDGIAADVQKVIGKADEIAADVKVTTGALAERSPKIVANLETGSDSVIRATTDIRDIIRAVGRSEGTFQQIISNPALYNNINDTASQFNKVMPRLDRITRDLETFADKIARHPESLGVGGVVRPSSGIKDIPSPAPMFPPSGSLRPRQP